MNMQAETTHDNCVDAVVEKVSEEIRRLPDDPFVFIQVVGETARKGNKRWTALAGPTNRFYTDENGLCN